MAKKGNTLTPHIRQVHHALAMANFIAFTAHTAAKHSISLTEREIAAGNAKWLISGAGILGRDIYAPLERRVLYGSKTVHGNELIGAVKESKSMAQADALVAAFEAMEQYIRLIATDYLYAKRHTRSVANKDKQSLARRFGTNAERVNTRPWFEQLVQVLAPHSAMPLFEMFFREIQHLRECVSGFVMGDLHVAHQAIEAIRHSKTHANGRYSVARLSKLPKEVRQQIMPCIRRSALHNVDWILPCYRQAADFIQREAEYAQLLYDSITSELGMELEWTPGHDPKTVAKRRGPRERPCV